MKNMMIFWVYLFVFPFVHCIYNNTEYLPMLNGNGAVLTASIDVTDFNRKLEKFVTVKVPEDIAEIFDKYINGERFIEFVKRSSEPKIKDEIKELFNAFTKSEEYNKDLEKIGEKILKGKFEAHVESSEYKDFVKKESKEEIKYLSENVKNDMKVLKKKINDMEQNMEHLLPFSPSDCSDVKERGPKESGINIIKTTSFPISKVFCDFTTDGGDWLVIQRRKDGSVDFYRNWEEYKNGFGNLNGEFWWGNEKIHQLTESTNYQLRIDLEDWDGSKAYALYSTFSIGDETSNYKLKVSGYSGDAGDGLAYSNNKPFSTKDKDNSGHNCPENCVGAWWYSNCAYSNLNGEYLKGKHDKNNSHRGVVWYYWKNRWKYSLKSSTMMIRRI